MRPTWAISGRSVSEAETIPPEIQARGPAAWAARGMLDRQRDAQRRNELQAIGRIVLEFTRADVVRRGDYVEQVLRRHLDGDPTLMSSDRAVK